MNAIVQATNLSKWYGQIIGLNDVSVAIGPGVTGLLGPNGAGKSTLMRLVTGQLKPSKGELRVFGQAIWNNPPIYTRLGFCPEQDAFYDRMTGFEFVQVLTRLHGYDHQEARDRAERAIATVDLLDARDRKIGGYSKGMRQRIKLAQAIAHDPEFLVLDEPLGGMDPIARRKTIRLIREWGQAGRSVLVSSHILHEVEAMTSTILLINHGRIVAEGNVHDIRALIDEHPHSVFIRCADPRRLASKLIADTPVISVRFEDGSAVTIETPSPDDFYAHLTELAATGESGTVDEVMSPDDNLAAVFRYLVK